MWNAAFKPGLTANNQSGQDGKTIKHQLLVTPVAPWQNFVEDVLPVWVGLHSNDILHA